MTTRRTWTQHKLTTHMLKRLAQLQAGLTPNYGTPMSALIHRDLVEEYEMEVDGIGIAMRWPVQACRITDAGREALAEARAEGW